MAEKMEQPTEEQTPVKQAKVDPMKPAKKAKKPKQPKQDDGLYLPVLAELTYASSIIFLILVFLAMAAVSLLTGTNALDFVLRTSVAMTVLGGLLLVVFHQVATGVLRVNQTEIEEKRKEETLEQLEPLKDVERPVNFTEAEKPKNVEVPLSIEAP